MEFNEKLQILRKEKGLTQEQLAEALNISFQAVSKWETGIALPDITMAPQLARFFGVSMDELFDFSAREIEKQVRQIADEACVYRETDPDRSRNILEAGLAQFPENEILLNHLLYVMNYSLHPDDTIALASRLIVQATQSDIRYDAYRFLAYALKAKGDIAGAAAAIDHIPEIAFTRLTEKAYLLSGHAGMEAAEKQKWISYENLLQMMQKLAEGYEAQGRIDLAAAETQNALSLLTLLHAPSFDIYTTFFQKQLERLLAQEQDPV